MHRSQPGICNHSCGILSTNRLGNLCSLPTAKERSWRNASYVEFHNTADAEAVSYDKLKKIEVLLRIIGSNTVSLYKKTCLLIARGTSFIAAGTSAPGVRATGLLDENHEGGPFWLLILLFNH